jgi:hypothetical protein
MQLYVTGQWEMHIADRRNREKGKAFAVNNEIFFNWGIPTCLIFKKLSGYRCPLSDEWIKKTWSVYTMEFYSAIKKNKIMSMSRKMDGTGDPPFKLSNQTQKDKYGIFFFLIDFKEKA